MTKDDKTTEWPDLPEIKPIATPVLTLTEYAEAGDLVICPECLGDTHPLNDHKDACSVCAGMGYCEVK